MFCEKLKMARKDQKITQVQLAKTLNVSQGTIANWENGLREPDLSTVQKIAEILNVSVDYLLDAVDSSKRPSQKVTDEDIKFALFHGEEGISDEAYEEVKQFAAFIKQKYKNK